MAVTRSKEDREVKFLGSSANLPRRGSSFGQQDDSVKPYETLRYQIATELVGSYSYMHGCQHDGTVCQRAGQLAFALLRSISSVIMAPKLHVQLGQRAATFHYW